MKKLFLMSLISLTSLASITSMAAECQVNGEDVFSQPEIFQEEIQKMTSCYDARELAESCAYGSGMDSFTAGSAIAVCESELVSHKPSADLKTLLQKMKTACNEAYQNKMGSMYRSFNAFCILEAVSFVNNLASAANESDE